MKTITPLEAAELLKKDSNAVLIDVRNPAEVAEVSVPGAMLIPLDQLSLRIRELEGKTPLLFMCRSGGRSSVAASIAEKAGLRDVHNVTGGITLWESSGLHVVHGGSRGFAHQNTLTAGGIILAGIFFATIIYSGNNGVGSAQASSFDSITTAQFAEEIQKPGAIILDVRTPEEYATGHIAGAININFYDSNFQEELNKLDKTATYGVYCRSGNRSGKTLPVMQSLGFIQVQDLSGGILSWASARKPIVR
jgi:rhodanese-related sulfurtransferase